MTGNCHVVAEYRVLQNRLSCPDCMKEIRQVRSLGVERWPAETLRFQDGFLTGLRIMRLVPSVLVVLANLFGERVRVVAGFNFRTRLRGVRERKLGDLQDALRPQKARSFGHFTVKGDIYYDRDLAVTEQHRVHVGKIAAVSPAENTALGISGAGRLIHPQHEQNSSDGVHHQVAGYAGSEFLP